MAIQLSTLRVTAEMDPAKYVVGMNAKVAADRAGTASSVAVGQAISQTDQKVSAAGDPLTRLSRQYVEGFRGAEQFNRAVATLGRGIETGNIPMERADAILDGIYRKFGMTASATELLARGETSLAAAVTAANARLTQQAGQIDTVTAATNRLAVANDNVATSRHNTSNIAAQFQDIGVTAAMGMSPMMIALQQGTQLSAALGNQGLRGTVMSLGGAFASVLSPVSLLTIGVVALGAVGIQTLMGIMGRTEDATSSLEEHKKWLDQILAGYEAAGSAANDALEQAQKLPSGVVRSDLLASLQEQDKAAKALQLSIDSARGALTQFLADARTPAGPMMVGMDAGPGFEAIVRQAQALRDLGLNTSSTTAELQRAQVAARELFNTTNDPTIKAMADQVYGLARQLAGLRGEMESTAAAMSSMQVISGSFSQLTGLSDAVADLKGMTPDLRTPSQRAQAVYDANSGSDASGELKKQLDYTLAQIAAEEALRNSRKSVTAGAKSFNQWDNTTDNFQQRIDSMRLEQETLGQSTYVAERNKAAFDLLNQAKQAGIPITSAVIDQINRQTEEYALVSVEMEKMHERQQQIDQINGTLASGFSNLFQGILNGSQTAAQGIGNLLNSLGSLFINKAFQMVFSGTSIGGGLGGGVASGGLLGGAIIPGILHDGGMAGTDGYGHGRSFSPSVWNGAVPYHTGGIAGLRPNEVPAILERGETITPRNQAAAANGSGDIRPVVQIIDQRTRGGSIKQEEATGANGEKQLRVIIRDEVQQARRRGAVGFGNA